MIINVAKLTDDPLVLDCRVPWRELRFDHQDARLRQDVELSARVTLLEKRALRVEGSCRTQMDFTCCRCLQTFKRPQNLDFDLYYMPHSSISRDVEEIELKDEDLNLGFYDGVKLDTNLVLAEQLLFSIPMKPLCQSNCKGLCQQCGTNLNIQPCHCQPPVVNPLREQMQELKRYLESKKK